MSTWVTGQTAEQLARTYLEQQGLSYCTCNYRCRFGEIDLIMQHHDCLVFVEVRYRQHQRYGGAIHSITATKRKRLTRTAQYYLQSHYKDALWPICRFDLIAIGPTLSAQNMVWLENILQM